MRKSDVAIRREILKNPRIRFLVFSWIDGMSKDKLLSYRYRVLMRMLYERALKELKRHH